MNYPKTYYIQVTSIFLLKRSEGMGGPPGPEWALSASSSGPGSGRWGRSSVKDVNPDNVVIGIWGVSPFIVQKGILGTAWMSSSETEHGELKRKS